MATAAYIPSDRDGAAWRGFVPGTWQERVNVREFIQRNYTPYEGDAGFLTGATERTQGIWKSLQPLLAEEQKKASSMSRRCLPGSLPMRPGISTKTTRSS